MQIERFSLATFRQPVRYAFEVRSLPASEPAPVPVRVDLAGLATWKADGGQAVIEATDESLVLRLEGFPARPEVTAAVPDSPDELMAAILGVHPWHWLAARGGADTEEEIARLRTACLDWVSFACLQPGLPFPAATFDAAWASQQLRRRCGTSLRAAVQAAGSLRLRVFERSAEAIAAQLRGAALEFRFPSTEEGMAQLREVVQSGVAPGKRHAVIPLVLPSNALEWDQAAVSCTAAGALYAGTSDAFRAQVELGFTYALAGEDTSIEVEARATIPAAQAVSFLASSQTNAVPPAAEPLDVAISHRLTTRQLQAWMELPRERSAAYFPWVSTVSVQLQQALRRWIPAFLLADQQRLEDLKQGPCYLLYRASTPHRPRTRAAFSNDVLDTTHVRSVYRSAQAGLKPLLPPIEAQLREAGLPSVARMYTARRIGRCLEPVRGEIPRALASLLASEAGLIEDVIRIATELSASANMQQRRALVREIPKAIQTALRRAAKGQALEWLAPVVFAEVTLAMAAAAGVEERNSMKAVVQECAPASDKRSEKSLEQRGVEKPRQTDNGDDRRRVRPEGECRCENGAGVQSARRPGERVHDESDSGAPGDARVVIPFPWPVLRCQPSGVEDGQGEPGPRLPDRLAA